MNEKLDQILAAMQAGFKEVNDKIDTMSHEIELIATTVNRIERKLDSTHDQVVRDSEFIIQILDGQGQQDRILEMLSLRSLSQEADIKDFKRIK